MVSRFLAPIIIIPRKQRHTAQNLVNVKRQNRIIFTLTSDSVKYLYVIQYLRYCIRKTKEGQEKIDNVQS
jgi:hypothetical protein